MAEVLRNLIEKLRIIKTYLTKIGPQRRKGNIIVVKCKEADDVVSEYNDFLEKLRAVKGNLRSDEILTIYSYRAQFDELYKQILDLCSQDTSENSTMAKFDLRTALSLLPVSNDEESSIKQLIDGIEYYQTELDVDSQKKLVNFVLKSRLSQAAKLKLSKTYDSLDSLLRDMKLQLLPKKSVTAIQRKLQNFRQNNLTIDEYGKQLTEMFVELTIFQSDGKDESFKVLKPLNEKHAIKCFADGLRNRRLSTVITARNYDSLKDAVQAAIDEETSSPSTSGDIMSMYRPKNQNNFRNSRGRATYVRTRGTSYTTGRDPTARHSYNYGQQAGAGRGWRGPSAPPAQREASATHYRGRGRSHFSRPRNTAERPHIRAIRNSISENSVENVRENLDQIQFFRD